LVFLQLSLGLFRCQLLSDGRELVPCLVVEPAMQPPGAAKLCTQSLSPPLYQQFLTIAGTATAVCLHHQHMAWQIAAQITVDNLVSAANNAVHSLADLQQHQARG
jgi:hypothetical protein